MPQNIPHMIRGSPHVQAYQTPLTVQLRCSREPFGTESVLSAVDGRPHPVPVSPNELPAQRGVWVEVVHRDIEFLRVESDSGGWPARAVISVTGTWTRPFIPAVPGRRELSGRQLHTVQYKSPAELAGQRVMVIGGGNSVAQIAAGLASPADLTWLTQRPPR